MDFGGVTVLLPDISLIRTFAEAAVRFTAVSPVASVMVKPSVLSTTWSSVMLMSTHLNGEIAEKVTVVVRDVKSDVSNVEKFHNGMIVYKNWRC